MARPGPAPINSVSRGTDSRRPRTLPAMDRATHHHPVVTRSRSPRFRWGLFVRSLSAVLAVVVVLSAVAFVVVGLRPLEQRAQRLVGDKPLTVAFRWPEAPDPANSPGNPPDQPDRAGLTWIPPDWQQRLLEAARARLAQDPDPLSPRALSAVSQWLADSGWFEAPPRVARAGATDIVIDGRWRTPEVIVRFADSDFWLSGERRLMPQVYPIDVAKGLRLILNPTSGPPLTPDGALDPHGQWAGDDLAASLELLRLAARQPWFEQVRAIDLAEHAKDGSLTIVSTHGTRIAWGGRPSKPALGDATTAQKLSNIETLHRDTGRIDGGFPVVYVGSPFVMFDRALTIEALARQNAAKGKGATPTQRAATSIARGKNDPAKR